MERKQAGHVITGGSGDQNDQTTAFFAGVGDHNNMKRSPSELEFQAFFMDDGKSSCEFWVDDFFSDHDVGFTLKNRDMIMNGFSNIVAQTNSTILSSQDITTKNSRVSATIDSQSSICVGSPISTNNQPKEERVEQGRGATSGSSEHEQSDDDVDLEAGPCEQSTDPTIIKRIRSATKTDYKSEKRMVSNRESARRSRKRKQAHLTDLEIQVEQLRGENSSLLKHYTDVTQQYREADTNNRVLKSGVEAMRARVKLAEEMVNRGSLTSSLNQLLQTRLGTVPPHMINHNNSPNNNLQRTLNVSPTITVHTDQHEFGGMAVSGPNSSLIGLGNAIISNHSITAGMLSDAVSCISDMWQ